MEGGLGQLDHSILSSTQNELQPRLCVKCNCRPLVAIVESKVLRPQGAITGYGGMPG